MPRNYSLYSQTISILPEIQMKRLAAGGRFIAGMTERGLTYTYTWPGLKIICTVMGSNELPDHLRGFIGYVVSHIYDGKIDARGQGIVDRIARTTLAIGVVIHGDADDQIDAFLSTLSSGLKPLVFYAGGIFDDSARLLLGPDKSFDPAAVVEPGKVPMEAASEQSAHATKSQIARFERSKAVLQKKGTPLFNGPLFVDDDGEATLRNALAVAKRTIVLWAIELRAEGVPKTECLQILSGAEVLKSVSPKENAFLQNDNPGPGECQKLVWRLECIWVFLWSLGHIKSLDWPGDCCDVKHLAGIMRTHESDQRFIRNAKLRSVSEVLDAQDLTMRIHWAIRNEWLNKKPLPVGLDWIKGTLVPIEQCRAVGVVEQRHYALNWMTCFDNADWDNVDTPT